MDMVVDRTIRQNLSQSDHSQDSQLVAVEGLCLDQPGQLELLPSCWPEVDSSGTSWKALDSSPSNFRWS